MLITTQQATQIIILLQSIDSKLGKGMQVTGLPKKQKKKKMPTNSFKETIRSQFLKNYSNE